MSTEINTSANLNRCPKCGGTGYVIYKKDQRELYGSNDQVLVDYAAQCPECNGGVEVRSMEIRSRANIPTAYYDATLNQFDWGYEENGREVNMATKKKLVQSFVSDFEKWSKKGMGLYIHSRTRGSGKTFLASCICNELMKDRAMTTKFVRVGDLLDIVKTADSTSPDEYTRNPVKLLQRCKLLVLDDIGQKQSGAAWLNDILFQITDQRVSDNLVTIYTGNIPLEELDVDERIVSRIYQKTIDLRLPEYSHRTKVASWEKSSFLRDIGVIAG